MGRNRPIRFGGLVEERGMHGFASFAHRSLRQRCQADLGEQPSQNGRIAQQVPYRKRCSKTAPHERRLGAEFRDLEQSTARCFVGELFHKHETIARELSMQGNGGLIHGISTPPLSTLSFV